MSLGAHILAVAEQVRAREDVYRTPATYQGYVSVQEKAPYTQQGGAGHRFPRGVHVHHCGITVAYIYALAGLRFGVDYPDGIQYSPTLAAQLLRGGYDTRPLPGAVGVIDWNGAGWGNTAASDHVVLIVKDEGANILVLDSNVTPDGRLGYRRYARGLFTAWGMPKTPPSLGQAAGPVRGAWLDGGPVGLADLKAGANNPTVARVQDAIINNTGLNEPVMTRGLINMEFLLNYKRWQQKLGYPGDGYPARGSLERLGFQVVDGTTLGPPPLPAVGKDFADKAVLLGGQGVSLGARTSGEKPLWGFGPPAVFYQHGILIRTRGTVLCVRHDIYKTWWDMAGNLGLPVEDEKPGPAAGTQIQAFEKPGTCLYWSKTHGTKFFNGPVGDWLRAGGEQVASMGPAVSDRIVTVPDTGRAAKFINGWAVWSPEAGRVVTVKAPIVSVYDDTAGTRGLGFPLSEATSTGGRTTQQFTKGTLTVAA